MRNRLPGMALAGLVLVAGAGAFAQAEAEKQLDAALARLRAALGPDVRLEIGARRVDPVTGQATLTNVVITDGENRYSIPELRLAELSETRIGRAEAIRARQDAPARGTAAEAGRITLVGLALPAPGEPLNPAALSLETLQVESVIGKTAGQGTLKLRNLSLSGLTRGGLDAGALEELDFAGDGPDAPSFRLGRVVLESVEPPLSGDDFDPMAFRAARIEIGGATLNDPSNQVQLSLASFALRDFIPGKLTSLGVQGLEVAAPAGPMGAMAVRLAALEVGGMDAAATLAAVMQGVQVPDPVPGTPQRVLIQGLDGSWQGQPVLTLGRFLTEGALEGGIARGAMLIEGLRVTPPRGQADVLEALGYREIAGELEMRGTTPRTGGRLEIAPLRLSVADAVTISIGAQLDGMPAAPEPGAPVDPDATLAALSASQLAGLTLTLQDHGLLGRVLAMQAREQRVPENRLREQWAQMALAMPLPGAPPPQQQGRRGAAQPQGKGGAPAAGADPLAPVRQAVASFIRRPGTLEIALRPPKPIAVMEIGAMGGDPVQAVQALGLTATAR